MDQAYISTIAALAGTVIGGLTSFLTAWVTQNVQARNQRLATETAKRQELYGAFMDELAVLYSHALRSNEMEYANLVKVFALRGRISLVATPAVAESADAAVKFLVDLYLGPPRTPEQVRAMMDNQTQDQIGEFALRCRSEFRDLRLV
jgi:hypothetical protein